MYRFTFPFGRTVFICEICGNESGDEKRIKECEAEGTPETTDLKGLDRVMIGGRSVVINDLFYTKPGDRINYYKEDKLPTHTLAARMWEPNSWLTPGQIAAGNRSGTHWTMLYSDILLWQEGDEIKLREAGLIKDPPPPRKKSILSRGWKKVWEKILYPLITGKEYH